MSRTVRDLDATSLANWPLPDASRLYEARSPVNFVDRLEHTPLLVMHGGNDPVVPMEQSVMFVQRCIEAGGNVEGWAHALA